MDELDSFGKWLKQRRRALHLTQEALAEQLYCALGTLRKIETDERHPSQELAERLAQVLQVPQEHQTTFVKVARASWRSTASRCRLTRRLLQRSHRRNLRPICACHAPRLSAAMPNGHSFTRCCCARMSAW